MTRIACFITVLLVPVPSMAADYTISFNPRDPNYGYNSNGPGDNDFDQTKPWTTWGTTGRDVANFYNGASSPIAAVWFKTINPGHAFSSACSGGSLFREVWMNQARTELIFRSATSPVQSGDYFWLKAVPATGVGGEPYKQFSAKFFIADPPIPSQGGWYQLANLAAAPVGQIQCPEPICCCCPPRKCGILRGCRRWCR